MHHALTKVTGSFQHHLHSFLMRNDTILLHFFYSSPRCSKDIKILCHEINYRTTLAMLILIVSFSIIPYRAIGSINIVTMRFAFRVLQVHFRSLFLVLCDNQFTHLLIFFFFNKLLLIKRL